MNSTLLKYDCRSLRLMVFGLTALLLLATVMLPAPFSPSSHLNLVHHFVFPLLAIVSAALVGMQSFSDLPAVDMWVLTRGMSRRQVFRTRWLTGLLVLTGMTAMMAAAMVFGVRQAVQQAMGNGAWYPMVRTGELYVVRNFFLVAIATYSAIVFFNCVYGFGATTRRSRSLAATICLLAAFAVGTCWQFPLRMRPVPMGYYLIGVVAFCGILTWAARTAFSEREIAA
ncbi:MAG: hypothetical protein AB8G99_12800 [Planctomycetaceae bacterium]